VTRIWDVETRSEVGASGQATGAAATDAVAPAADGEAAARGPALFRKCAACHSVTANGGNRAGPTLYGVFGRRAGTVAGYNYSKALRGSDLTWNEETIDRLFDLGPHEFTPGSKMPLQRMPSAQDREDLITYLKTITAAGATAK
jgi:cytochrome c